MELNKHELYRTALEFLGSGVPLTLLSTNLLLATSIETVEYFDRALRLGRHELITQVAVK